jgi:hypothetical protein
MTMADLVHTQLLRPHMLTYYRGGMRFNVLLTPSKTPVAFTRVPLP